MSAEVSERLDSVQTETNTRGMRLVASLQLMYKLHGVPAVWDQGYHDIPVFTITVQNTHVIISCE